MSTKSKVIHTIQIGFIIIGLIQLLNNAVVPAIVSIYAVYIVGALEY